ncbi:hypothetical protein VOLCADRAFT_96258 [Volvox carteri f. nagariensis]|uniref:Uncharacterized protein n=1 Tax=Volvox carteri f. nagariensis TaxID=3068 RepID=D8U9M6_VOLCA|nr:uncharacterized protein VOLCADRAFT_96258 [Volvox carteri f. nagariensis]EFJ43668.1 hypothetical protein VOLCADRAFT_96258 [Volvox carteri f. nagariensis]|eukprot:XP_002955368.1 hypothetical protein VOLCADRAFT_96258 [Volvox carteri f. nagariensis]
MVAAEPAGLREPAHLYDLSDLAVTFAVDAKNAPLVVASRAWRAGLRTHVMVDQGLDVNTLRVLAPTDYPPARLPLAGAPYGESFTALPNFPGHPATLRQALAPVFAFEEMHGQFKWLLVGDADTVFVPRAVLNLLNSLGLPADEPHMLSDFLVECELLQCKPGHCPCSAPKRVDPRCLPCAEAGAARLCPCRLPEPCSRPRSNTTAAFPEECPVQEEVSAYGGAGIIYSVGLMRELMADPQFYAAEALRTLRSSPAEQEANQLPTTTRRTSPSPLAPVIVLSLCCTFHNHIPRHADPCAHSPTSGNHQCNN